MNKLQKFAEMAEMANVIQCSRRDFPAGVFPLCGRWRQDHFHNELPIVLELGCGRGEYAVALAEKDPGRNYIGIDIKGARMYTGARLALDRGLPNCAFLRTEIEILRGFFAPEEVEEIWITFPDPQMKKSRKRLTSTRFLALYRRILRPGGIVNLKTDSPFLFEYTRRLVELNGFETLRCTDDLYGAGEADPVSSIKTYYEQQWLARGKKIKLISFRLPQEGELLEPREDDIERDDYRAMPRPNF